MKTPVKNVQDPREQQVQRPEGGSVCDRFEEKQGGQCGWSRVSEAENTGTGRMVGK